MEKRFRYGLGSEYVLVDGKVPRSRIAFDTAWKKTAEAIIPGVICPYNLV